MLDQLEVDVGSSDWYMRRDLLPYLIQIANQLIRSQIVSQQYFATDDRDIDFACICRCDQVRDFLAIGGQVTTQPCSNCRLETQAVGHLSNLLEPVPATK
jgi:hypothetical protein